MTINSFRNEYFFLSNFYEVSVKYRGLTYRNSEAAFQAQKCTNPKDKIAFTNLNASEAKHRGRSIELVDGWEQVKVSIMTEIVQAKFEQNKDIAQKLIATGDAFLEEGNNWGDRIWGTVNGQGSNLLGFILMKVREHLKEVHSNDVR